MSETTKEKPKAAAAEAQNEQGDDLMAALMQALADRVEEKFVRVPNPSGTYERLMIGKKAFAYIFPPRRTGLAVKIPKPLLAVEGSLPKGHGFHRTNWGLTRTISRRSEAPKVAQALAVAAAAVAEKAGV